MPRRRHTPESIVQTLQNLAKRLGQESLSKRDVQSVIANSTIDYHFGSLGKALQVAGLKARSSAECTTGRFRAVGEEELFRSILRVETQLGREPRQNECHSLGGYAPTTFRRRFGKWPEVLAHYRKWRAEHKDEIAGVRINSQPDRSTTESEALVKTANLLSTVTPAISAPAQLYGEPIDFRGLRHAPINEQGVVYLFGMVSRELGFYIEAIQQGFPDCEGKYRHDAKKNLWAKARIEFEFRASAFREHGHNPNQCDFIVCWLNDWPDCPIRVIELRQELLKLPSK